MLDFAFSSFARKSLNPDNCKPEMLETRNARNPKICSEPDPARLVTIFPNKDSLCKLIFDK